MKAAILTETGFEIQDLPRPEPGDDELLIRTTACGICSGDVYVYKNRATLAATESRLGHEGSGVVAAVGRRVTGFQPGDVVTSLGMPAYADYYLTIPAKLVRLPSEIDPALALGEAIACCVHASHRFGTRPGDRIALLGCGFMGLICLRLAKRQGAGFTLAIDPLAERREMAHRYGADAGLDPSGSSPAEILAEHGVFDVVIEAVGSQNALDLSTPLVKQHGRLILIGYHQSQDGRRTVDMKQWNFKGIDVINAHVRRQDEKAAAMAEGMALLQQGELETAPLVTTYPFTEIEQAFRDLASGRPGLYKGVVLMEPDQ